MWLFHNTFDIADHAPIRQSTAEFRVPSCSRCQLFFVSAAFVFANMRAGYLSLMSKGDGKAKGKCKGTAQDEAVAEESEIPPPPAAPLGESLRRASRSIPDGSTKENPRMFSLSCRLFVRV